jgi:hypothetical protein
MGIYRQAPSASSDGWLERHGGSVRLGVRVSDSTTGPGCGVGRLTEASPSWARL